MITLTIDGQSISVPKGTTVYHAAKLVGVELPIFCYESHMPPFGACRVCLVEVEKMPKLQTSCTLEVTEGMVVKTQSENAIKGRESILEFLLINHPLDCPICDRGGECPLQEQALDHGPGESRFYEEKRHFSKRLPLGPVLMLDRERCIVCARCTRFGELIAGDHALQFLDRGYKTEVGTPDSAPAKSKFIGNTIKICPVGALTSQVYRFRARPWDNDSTESSCTLCPVGCSLILDARDGEIMRTRVEENKEVNDAWLCDKGWFGYEFTSSPKRLKTPLLKRNGRFEAIDFKEALELIAVKIVACKSGQIAGFGGNPLTLEENYLFQKLLRDVLGVNHLDHRIGTPCLSLEEEGLLPGMEMNMGELEELSYAVLLGFDLTEEFPILWLRLRAAINKGAKVIFFGHFAPEIAPHLTNTVLHRPGKEIETLDKYLPHVRSIAQAGEKKGALFVGNQYLASENRLEILAKLLEFKSKVSNLSLNIMEGRGNSMGARIAGMRPDLNPFGMPSNKKGLNALEVLQSAKQSGWEFLMVAGANPAKKFPTNLWQEARQNIKFMVVQDVFLTETAEQADLVLPTLTFVEKGGKFVNIEGRLQNLLPGKEIPNGVFSDGGIFKKIAETLGKDLELDAAFLELIKLPKLDIARREAINVGTQKAKIDSTDSLLATFAYSLFDEGVRMQHDTHLKQLVTKPKARLHPLEAVKRGVKDGELVLLSSQNGNVLIEIQFEERVAAGTIVLPLGFPEVPLYNLATPLLNGLPLTLSKEE